MKKRHIRNTILIILLLIFSVGFLKVKNKSESNNLIDFDINIYEELLSESKNIELPNFTKEELEQINYYRENPLKVGQFEHEYYFTKINDEKVGINYYTILLLEELLDIKTESYEIDYKNIQKDLLNETYDIAIGVYDTTITEESLNITEPYAFSQMYLYTKNDVFSNSIMELDDINIGIISNLYYIIESNQEYIQKFDKKISFKSFESYQDMIDAYNNNEVDALMNSVSPILMQNDFNNIVNTNIFSKKLRFAYKNNIVDENFISVIEKIFFYQIFVYIPDYFL